MIDNDVPVPAHGDPPLCVDLDGTLVNTDLLWESVASNLRLHPARLLCLPFWWLQGRPTLKRRLAQTAHIDFACLPYRAEVVEFVRARRAAGQKVLLATATTHALATGVAAACTLFDGVIASDAQRNLKGQRKADELVGRFGRRGFDYVGDSHADLPVWAAARRAFVAGPGAAALLPRVTHPEVAVIAPATPAPSRLRALLRALRPHQWVKNLLVVVPLVAAHRIADPSALAAGALALLAFCACASSAYLVNDVLDLEADRAHLRKRGRPLANGDLSIPAGLFAACALLGVAALLAWRLPAPFQWSLGLYLVLTVAYSATLKRRLAVDVIVLAGLYTLRIIAGGMAIQVAVSFWLLAFSLFLFFSLALLKRYVELSAREEEGGNELPRRGYRTEDKPAVLGLGTAAGLVAAMVLALYVNGDTAGAYYGTPEWLWLLCPLLMYWIARIWMLATRGDVHDDPVVFASTDRVSHAVAVAALLVLWLAT